MDKLPDDILAIILEETDVSTMLVWAMTCAEVAPNIKNYTIRNKINKLGLINHAIIDYNVDIFIYLAKIGWVINVSHLATAAYYGHFWIFEKLSKYSSDMTVDEIIHILCRAVESNISKNVKQVLIYYGVINDSPNSRYGLPLYDNNQLLKVTRQQLEPLMHVMCKNFDFKISKLLWNIPKLPNFCANFAALYGYIKMLKHVGKHYGLDDSIMFNAIKGGHKEIMDYLHNRLFHYNVNYIKEAIRTGNINTLNIVINYYGHKINKLHYEDLQIAAIDGGIEMFKYVDSKYRARTFEVSKAVFQSENTEIMEYLHKNNYPISNKWGVTGLSYMHEFMDYKLDSSLYVKALTQDDPIEIIEYLVDNEVLMTRDAFESIQYQDIDVDVWKAIIRAPVAD